jgi:hypothetical protein
MGVCTPMESGERGNDNMDTEGVGDMGVCTPMESGKGNNYTPAEGAEDMGDTPMESGKRVLMRMRISAYRRRSKTNRFM